MILFLLFIYINLVPSVEYSITIYEKIIFLFVSQIEKSRIYEKLKLLYICVFSYQFSQTGTQFWIECPSVPAKEINSINQHRKNRRRSEPNQHQQSSVKSNNKTQQSNESSIKSPDAKLSTSPRPDNSNPSSKPNRYQNNKQFRQYLVNTDQPSNETSSDLNTRTPKKPFKHRSFGGNQNPGAETGVNANNLATGELEPNNSSRKPLKYHHSVRRFPNKSENTSINSLEGQCDPDSTSMTAGSSKQLYKNRSSTLEPQPPPVIQKSIAKQNEIICEAGPSNASLSR